MIQLLITLLIIGVLVGLIWWVCDALPVPQPLNKFIKIASVVVAVIVLVFALAQLGGYNLNMPAR